MNNEPKAVSGIAGYSTPPIPPGPLPDLGDDLISSDRYHSKEWMDREWSSMWTKVWNLGVRETEIPDPGDFVRHSLGKEDLIFMRGDDGVVRGFYNVCRHRGNRICQGGREGHLKSLTCPYHGWTWNRNGSLDTITDPEFFSQFRNTGVPEASLGLHQVKVELWAGWTWFCMDPNSKSLRDYLGDVMDHVGPYQMENWDIVDYKTFEWHCNWKHGVDAFSESYHFEALHPQVLQWASGHAVPMEIMGIHSRMYNYVGKLGPHVADREAFSDSLLEAMKSYMGISIDPDSYNGKPEEVYLELRKRKRAIQDDTHYQYRDLTDEQLSEICHYGIFPNVIWALTPEGMVMFRPRPHESDPSLCYFDLVIMQHTAPGEEKPEFDHECIAASYAGPLSDVMNIHPINSQVVEQDAANLPSMQEGTRSDVFEGSILCDQEVRVRNFHKSLDRILEHGGLD